MTRTILKLAAVVLLLAGGLLSFTVVRLRTGPDIRSETMQIEGLQAPVEILYDSMGVPHIFAASMDDLFLAQGHVHATHRLWQMEMFRRVQEGRLSEIFGESMVDTDRFLRTIGLGESARQGLPSPHEPILSFMEQYADGVNAAIEGWRGFLPPEFVLVRFRPEPWAPVHSQGLEKIMAWDLSDYDTGLNLAAAREVLGDSAMRPLMPRYPEWGVTIVEGWPNQKNPARSEEDLTPFVETVPNPPQGATLPPAPEPGLLSRAAIPPRAAGVLDLGSVVRASNSWVVGGERSSSGKPVLANDMHLALDAPNIWFLIGLHAPGFDVVGMSLPGAPGVIAGHSRAVAWGYTNAMADDSDFFLERVNPDNAGEYLTPEGWTPFQIREETIRVRGDDPVTLAVNSTRHGPVITPVEQRAGEQVLAYQWVAHSPARTFQALLSMGMAKTAGEFVEALKEFDNPHQNVIFADTAGAWGYWLGGRIPRRASEPPPHLPVPGWTGEHDWIGWVPFEDKPHVLAPERGYIATANNAQSRAVWARPVSDNHWAAPYRAQRISELIEHRPLHDAESLLAIQMHPGSARVTRYLPLAVEAFRGAGLEALAQRLEGWDGKADLESTEATLFHSWWSALRDSFQEHYYDGARGYFPEEVLERALDGEMELPEGLSEAAALAASGFAYLPWGEAHQLDLEHSLTPVPLVGKLFRFGRLGIPQAGGPNSVNVSPFTGSRPPFRADYGPSQRHVVDLANPDGSGGFILPGGQSGYPGNPHAFDQLKLWQEGRLWVLPLDRGLAEARAVAEVMLVPGER